MSFRLQVKTAGAWRRVCDFRHDQEEQVLIVVQLLREMAPDAEWRFLDGSGNLLSLEDCGDTGQLQLTEPAGRGSVVLMYDGGHPIQMDDAVHARIDGEIYSAIVTRLLPGSGEVQVRYQDAECTAWHHKSARVSVRDIWRR